MKKTLYVIDGHALCYRAYFAFIRNPLLNSSGQNTSAIFGFARMLYKLVQDQHPDYLLVAFDPKVKSARFETYPAYKANRVKMPDDMRSQVDEIQRMVDELGLVKIVVDGFEADDVLGTIAARYAGKDLEVVLVTGDKDAYQLVNDHVWIYANKKGISDYECYDAPAVRTKLGIDPSQVIDYMALMGDASDNIPGVKGIGEKTALKLIQQYGTLDDIYANIDAITGKVKDMLASQKEMAYLSRELVTVRHDAPLELDFDKLSPHGIFSEHAREYFRKLEMSSIVSDFFAAEERPQDQEKPGRRYVTVTTEAQLMDMIAEIRAAGEVSVDTETTSLSPIEASLVGMSFSIKANEGWYIPLLSQGLFGGDYLERSVSLAMVKPLLEDPAIRKIGQNIKFDMMSMRNEGIELRGVFFDTMVASYLINPAERRHNLDDLAAHYLNYRTITFKDLVGTGKNAVPITEVPLERISEYAIEDADIAWRLYELFRTKLVEDELDRLFHEIEMPLVEVLAEMEYRGVRIDLRHFEELAELNRKNLADAEKKIYEEAGQVFNINSTRELAYILFEKCKLKPQKKTKTGYSTDISVLESLKGSHPLVEHLIGYRTMSKLMNTYIESLPRLVSPRTGRIHTSYNQAVVATGRLSSSDPNLQNIPVRDEFGRQIRRGFVPEKGWLLMAADYSQIELRLAAHISGDENMRTAFREGRDIHLLTAASVFGVPFDQVTQDMRRQGKLINFATIYGVSAFGLSQQAEIDIPRAAEFIRIYFETYPGFKEYIDDTVSYAREHGYVKTLLGRKRTIPEINAEAKFPREGAERIAINTPIQGTAADMIKIAMNDIARAFTAKKLKSKMIMQVHDELVFEVPEDEKGIVGPLVREKMEHALDLAVPIVVDMGWGGSWEEAH